jgi:hypothetical protein
VRGEKGELGEVVSWKKVERLEVQRALFSLGKRILEGGGESEENDKGERDKPETDRRCNPQAWLLPLPNALYQPTAH